VDEVCVCVPLRGPSGGHSPLLLEGVHKVRIAWWGEIRGTWRKFSYSDSLKTEWMLRDWSTGKMGDCDGLPRSAYSVHQNWIGNRDVSMNENRVVVVGGGVIGLCTAYALLQRGRDVVVLERGTEGAGNCSRGNAGMVVPSHFVPLAAPGVVGQGMKWLLDPESPFWVRPRASVALARWGWLFLRHATRKHVAESAPLLRDLSLESSRLFVEWEKERSFGLVRRGLMMLCETEEALEEEAELAGEARELGLEVEVCDAKRLAERDPGVDMSAVGGVWHGQDCHMDPSRFLDELRRRIVKRGGEIRYHARVRGIEDGRAVLEDGEVVRGGAVVVAGGAWSPELARSLGLRLPMQAGKGYSMTIGKPAQLPELCSILCEAKVAVTPMDGKLRFAGTMEVGANDLSVNPRRVAGIRKAACRVFPRFGMEDFEGVRTWAGLRPCSPDGLPYVGEMPGQKSVFVATGHAMMGLSLGPVTGEVVASLVEGEAPVVAVQKLAVARFG
jgi:D-amino-acid dehydrogenase